MQRTYFEDVQILESPAARFWFGAFVAGLAVLPMLVPGYTLGLVSFLAVNVIITFGMNVLVGYTGQISLGHAGFVAIGAYGTVLLMTAVGWPFLAAILAASLLTAAFGFLLGLPALRLEGPYLAIATLGFGLAVTQIIGRFPIFGGRMGLAVPDMDMGPVTITSSTGTYYVFMSFTLLLGAAAHILMKGRIGRAFLAIRDSDVAAEALGINLAQYKTLSFAISAFYAGLAGGLVAIWLSYINPDQFSFLQSVLYLAMVVVGGPGSTLGSVLGGTFVGYLTLKMDVVQELPIVGSILEWISAHWLATSGLPNAGWVFMGLLMVLIVLFEPLGLYGLWRRTKTYWTTWPF